MSPYRFIHTSDIHIGRRCSKLLENIRGRLVEAGHLALDRLAAAARDHGVTDTSSSLATRSTRRRLLNRSGGRRGQRRTWPTGSSDGCVWKYMTAILRHPVQPLDQRVGWLSVACHHGRTGRGGAFGRVAAGARTE